jgi:hypothetical protein
MGARESVAPRGSSARSPRRRLILAVATLASIVGAGIGATAAWAAYWDYQGSLCSGCSYGEAQGGTLYNWNIRVSRAACGPDAWIQRRSDSAWVWQGVNCGGANDYTVLYSTYVYKASKATNAAGGSVYTNVRIDQFV